MITNTDSAASYSAGNHDLRTALLRDQPTNAALQRLQSRVLTKAEPSDIITSYDRMHHRHSRS